MRHGEPGALPTLPALVVGSVNHTRRVPIVNSFEYKAYQWLVDVDAMPELPFWLRPLASFSDSDHLECARTGRSLREEVAAVLAGGELELSTTDRVVMLANARVLGHVFNPLTVFWVVTTDGEVRAAVFEVHNTYGEHHSYLLKIDHDGRAEVDKQLYVSPFNDESGSYRVRLKLDAASIKVTVSLDQAGSRILSATTEGRVEPATTGSLLRVGTRHFLMAQRVSALIRLNGIRLWLRGLPIQSRPTRGANRA